MATGGHFEKFKRPFIGNLTSDPVQVWFLGGAFLDLNGGSNGAISGWTKFKMAAS